MYTKTSLIADLEKFQPADEKETRDKATILALLNSTDKCFERSDFPAHITGSALLLSPDQTQTLLTHHKFLNQWFQFGGHADGDVDIRNVALREAQEESGIMDIEFVTPEIFDIDIHPIPANPKKNEPAHFHYDIRYLLRAKTVDFAVSDESHDLKWFAPEQLGVITAEPSMLRMIKKWKSL